MRTCFGHAIAVFVLLVSNPLGAAEPPPGSLQPLFDEAQRLAADPATQEGALTNLEAIVDSHRTNSKLYDQALSQLFRHYIETGRGEQAARLAAETMDYENRRIQQPVLSRLFEEAQRKFPEEFAKLAAGHEQGSPQQQA